MTDHSDPGAAAPESGYRHIPRRHGACAVCDQVFQLTWPRRAGGRACVWTHGPRSDRCPGSGQPPQRWLEAARLPGWDDLSDLDKGAALLHVWKRKWEGGPYAQENYPARYFDHPDLLALDRFYACRHAVQAAGYHDEAWDRLGEQEHQRLYNLALDADTRRHRVAGERSHAE